MPCAASDQKQKGPRSSYTRAATSKTARRCMRGRVLDVRKCGRNLNPALVHGRCALAVEDVNEIVLGGVVLPAESKELRARREGETRRWVRRRRQQCFGDGGFGGGRRGLRSEWKAGGNGGTVRGEVCE
eukprot:1419828-Pleurochrysis_carterae.AAC.3